MDLSYVYSKSSLWVQDGARIGSLFSFTPPAMTATIGDFKTTWMDMAMGVDTGMDPMTSTFKVGADLDILTLFGIMPGKTTRIQAKRTYKDINGNFHTFIDEMEGIISTQEPDEHGTDGKESVGYTITMRLNYYRLTVNGEEIYEINPYEMIRSIRGVNMLQEEKDAHMR